MTDIPDFNEATATDLVLGRTGAIADPRLRQVMESVVRHLHAVVREVEPTPAEWMAAIQYLTRTGQACTESRQEFILLSDILGVSMLVDAIDGRRPAGATESTVLGPFHVGGLEILPNGASICEAEGGIEPLLVEAVVLDTDGRPLAGAIADVWQTGADGRYDVQRVNAEADARGRFQADAEGRFSFRTVRPSPYSIPVDGPIGELLGGLGRSDTRPAHIHFILEAPGHRPLTTHLFVDGDPHLATDPVFGVKRSLVVTLDRDEAGGLVLRHTFRLAPAVAGEDRAAPVYSAGFSRAAE